MIKLLKKRWKDALLAIFLLLMIIPQTRKPIQIKIQKLIAFSPSVIDKEEQKKLSDYHLILQNQNLKEINLTEAKGEVIIINFWATWCPPCIAEMPDFKNLYSDYNKKVRFYFVTNDNWDLVSRFEEKRKLELPYYKALSKNNELIYPQLPTTYVIDKNGNIIVDKVGVAKWNSNDFRMKLDELINE